jgi:hypothetical protein
MDSRKRRWGGIFLPEASASSQEFHELKLAFNSLAELFQEEIGGFYCFV